MILIWSHRGRIQVKDFHYFSQGVFFLMSISVDLFADGNDFSWETIQKGRNIYYQKQLANEIINQMTEVLSLLSSSININLNIGQNLKINTSQVFMSLETQSLESLSNKLVKQVGNGQIQIPQNFNSNLSTNSKISIRVS
jgi:hypothetical protein